MSLKLRMLSRRYNPQLYNNCITIYMIVKDSDMIIACMCIFQQLVILRHFHEQGSEEPPSPDVCCSVQNVTAVVDVQLRLTSYLDLGEIKSGY